MKNSGRNISLTSYDDLFSTEEIREAHAREQVQQIPLSELYPFKDHPFRVMDDDRMMETVESIKEYGVLVPVIARPLEEGGYEIIAGHRRKRACELAFTPAVELSYLKPEEQKWLQTALEVTQQTPSLSQAQRMKKESKEGTLSEQSVMDILSEEKKPLYNSVTLSHDTLKKYFPKSYTAKQMEKVILKLLDSWLRSRQRSQER